MRVLLLKTLDLRAASAVTVDEYLLIFIGVGYILYGGTVYDKNS
jgi:hypothetical protein